MLCVLLAAASPASVLTVPAFAVSDGCINVSEYVSGSGSDVSAAIREIIESNPNRTLFFPDGEYILSEPIKTPADPKRSVSLKLSDFAVLKAAPGWQSGEAVVQLGAIYPANDTRTPGSNYSLEGGIIDGAGVANGISINGGRETAVRNVSVKNAVIGLHIMYGANSGSSDADISGLNIIGTGGKDSTGILIEGFDNTLTNIRIGNVYTGVHIKSAGNSLRNIHPLYYSDYTDYPDSCGFLEECGNNWYDFCYSDQFGTGFRTTSGSSIFNDCYCFWYSPKGESHTAFRSDGKFRSTLTDFKADLPDSEGNEVLVEGEPGGNGVITNLKVDESRISSKTYKAHCTELPGFVRLIYLIFSYIKHLFR